MKNIFTLLFCVVALTAAADNNSRIEQCVNALLNRPASNMIMATNFDVDGDGVLTIADVTTLIDQSLEAQVNRAPSQKVDIDALAKEITLAPNHQPNINDLNEAIDENLKEE